LDPASQSSEVDDEADIISHIFCFVNHCFG